MTAGAFERCCAAKKATAVEEEKKWAALKKGSRFASLSACSTCAGPPPELIIIPAGMGQPSTKTLAPKHHTAPAPARPNGEQTEIVKPRADQENFLRNGYRWMPIVKLCKAFNQRFAQDLTELNICQMLIRYRVPDAKQSQRAGV